MRVPTSLSLTTLLLVSYVHRANGATCKLLTDPTNNFITSLAAFAQVPPSALAQMTKPMSDVFMPLSTMMPALSTCMAAIDMSGLAVAASAPAAQACITTMNTTILMDVDSWTDKYVTETVCPMMTKTVVPCVGSVATGALATAMANSGGCCDAFTTSIKSGFGMSMTNIVTEMLQLTTNVVCSTKTYTQNAVAVTSTCGSSLAGTMMGTMMAAGNNTDMVLNALQIPNNQVCAAVAGNAFTTTMGTSMTLKSMTAPIGICYETLNNMFQHLKDYPMMADLTMTSNGKTVALKEMFADGKCVAGNELLMQLAADGSFLMQFAAMYDAAMTAMFALSGGAGPTPTPTPVPTTVAPTETPTPTETPVPTPQLNVSSHTSDGLFGDMSMALTVKRLLTELAPSMASVCLHMPNSVTCNYGTDSLKVAFHAVVPTVAPPAPTTTPTPTPTPTAGASSMVMSSLVVVLSAQLLVLQWM